MGGCTQWGQAGVTHDDTATDYGPQRIIERHLALADGQHLRDAAIVTHHDIAHVPWLTVDARRQAVHLIGLTSADLLSILIHIGRYTVGHKMRGHRGEVGGGPHVAKLVHVKSVSARPQAAHVNPHSDIAQRSLLLKRHGAEDLRVDAIRAVHARDGAIRHRRLARCKEWYRQRDEGPCRHEWSDNSDVSAEAR